MYQVFNKQLELCAAFASEIDTVAYCEARRVGRPLYILEPGLSPIGFVVDSLWADSEPGTSCVFPTREDAALFTAEPREGCVVQRIRELSLESLSAVRRVGGDWAEVANSLRMYL